MYLAQARVTPGIHLAAIADLNPQRARESLVRTGWPREQYAAASLAEALAILGLVAGITGIGGGVYLVPLILLLGLGTTKEAATCGAFFIWVNSAAGLLPRLQQNSLDPLTFAPLAVGVLIGGTAGSFLGAGRFEPRTMQKILGSVLVVAIISLGRKITMIVLM